MHNNATGLFAELARKCGYFTETEPRKLYYGARVRPDLKIDRYHALSAKPTAIDLTFPCATAQSNISTAATGTGSLADHAEMLKRDKYSWKSSPLTLPFKGAAMDSLGAVGKGMRSIVAHLCSSADTSFNGKSWAAPTMARCFYQKLGIIVIKGFASKVRAGSRRVLKALMRRGTRGIKVSSPPIVRASLTMQETTRQTTGRLETTGNPIGTEATSTTQLKAIKQEAEKPGELIEPTRTTTERPHSDSGLTNRQRRSPTKKTGATKSTDPIKHAEATRSRPTELTEPMEMLKPIVPAGAAKTLAPSSEEPFSSATESANPEPEAATSRPTIIGKGQTQIRHNTTVLTDMHLWVNLAPYHKDPVNGLFLIPASISSSETAEIMAFVKTIVWDTSIARRTKQFGWQYNHKDATLSRLTNEHAVIPHCFSSQLSRLKTLLGVSFNQLIINRYEPTQGIAHHTDHHEFGGTIVSISMGEAGVMSFTRQLTRGPLPNGRSSGKFVAITLEPGSLLVLSGEARSCWKHGISKEATATDSYGRTSTRRGIRISLTFRECAEVSGVVTSRGAVKQQTDNAAPDRAQKNNRRDGSQATSKKDGHENGYIRLKNQEGSAISFSSSQRPHIHGRPIATQSRGRKDAAWATAIQRMEIHAAKGTGEGTAEMDGDIIYRGGRELYN